MSFNERRVAGFALNDPFGNVTGGAGGYYDPFGNVTGGAGGNSNVEGGAAGNSNVEGGAAGYNYDPFGSVSGILGTLLDRRNPFADVSGGAAGQQQPTTNLTPYLLAGLAVVLVIVLVKRK